MLQADDVRRPAAERAPGPLRLLPGVLAFAVLLVLPPPEGLAPVGMRVAAVAALMAVWWITEAVPIAATALLPLALFPVLGVADMATAAAGYANDLIFLQMGGFFLAAAMTRWGLHRRIALGLVGVVGTGPRAMVLGFMLAAAFLSMWISNTATTAAMLPIGMAVGAMFALGDGGSAGTEGNAEGEAPARSELGVCLMLGIAYGATIGGVTTLIGTPPNVVLAGYAREQLGIEIGFVEWMIVGVPVAAVFLPVGWFLLTFWLHPPGSHADPARVRSVLAEARAGLGPMRRGEALVALVFALTAFAWILRAPKDLGGGLVVPGIQTFAPMVRDSTLAMLSAVALFVVPVSRGEKLLDWETASRIPWGVLVLFGGGMSLAAAIASSGLADWIGAQVAVFGDLPPWLFVLIVAAVFVFLTEITSNLATATMAMPVMASVAVGLGAEPLVLATTATLSASMAFMLPVATPPNAIVFGSGWLTVRGMARVGLWFNLVAVVLVGAASVWLVPLLLPA